jgi:hypothetical protein
MNGTSPTAQLFAAFELHSATEIRAALDAGADPLVRIDGKVAIEWLAEMYTRSARFGECLLVLIEAGARFPDPLLEPLLLDDADALRALLATTPERAYDRLFLDCAFTSLHGVSPLHVCAEYNSVRCARVLLDAGVDVDHRAAVDGDGLGGHTALFHTVNSPHNHCRPMMELLVDAGARLDIRVDGLVWGDGFDWETVVFDVTPLSYAQCGLYAQFHRAEAHVYDNLDHLYRRRHGREPVRRNVPNRYLQDDRVFPPRG